jgi:regulation of enolase protein 1 (concanavalin A-like superfamily)
MWRADTSTGSIDAAVVATTNNGITFQWRATAGGSCSFQIAVGGQNLGVPVWLKLTRAANSFSGYYGTDGVNWTQIGSTQTVPMGQSSLAGLAVSAGNSSALCTATFSDVSLPPPLLGIYRELWSNLSASAGNTLAALTNTTLNPNWPNNPDANATDVYVSFETQTNTGINNYGQRLRTFIVPPTNGNFTFWVSSDNTSELLLSSDETAANAAPIAWVSTFTVPREWTKEANQQSAPISLQAGHRYYLEALMQHSTGDDNLAVRWQLPNNTLEEPLVAMSPAGTRLIPCDGLDTPPGIYAQPTNLAVADGYDAAFALLVTNRGPVSYQWLVNGANAAGAAANSPVYAVSNANPLINNGQFYSCVISNALGVVTSTPALLTVPIDTVPPVVQRAIYLGPTNLQLVFSEALAVASATNLANYTFTNATPLLGVLLAADNLTVTLITPPLVANSNYVMVLNGIRDRATVPNTIATNTLVPVFTGSYAPQAIGAATPAGSIIAASGGFNVAGGGSTIGGTSDQFQFAYEVRSGDFDIMARLNALTQTDPFAQAGLIAREDLTPNGRFAAALATPSLNGAAFESRSAVGAAASTSGSVRVNYPDMWLRLQRVGSQFTGYASYDGLLWQQMGTVSIAMTNPIYFGMAVCSHNTGSAAVAQFRNISPVTNALAGTLVLPSEPLGPSSRKTPIAISEIMYKPAPRTDTNNLEFIEIYNSNPWFHDISGYRLSGTTLNYTFPAGTVLPGGAFLVIAASPQNIQSVYGITNVIGPYTGSLKKAETLQLFDEVGAVLLTVPYSNVYPWPVATDGTGHSLVLARPTYGEEDPRAWDISDSVGGSPGQIDGFRPSPLRNVVINEFLAHTDPPDYDYIELYNHANQPVDISGCILTDDAATNKFVIPAGTIIPARGFISYSETNMNFRLSAAGETIYFKNPDQSRYLDAVQFGGQENGVATGRWPDGANEFYRLSSKTPGGANAPILKSDIVINELMYDPISGNDDDQYIELYNRSGNTVNLGGWQLSDAVSFTFPSNTVLAPDAYLVVARNAAHLRTNYPNLTPANCLGNYTGKLSHNGEHLALSMPDTTVQTNSSGVVSTNLIHIVVNDLTYSSGGRWGQWSAGGGSSLELIDPNANNRLAANWADSDETQKSTWVNIETTGVLDNGANYDPTIDYAQIGLLDVGECLVDNIEVRSGTAGANLVVNPDFETGLGNWSLQGDQSRSTLENSGYASAHSLHIRCSDRLWTGDNSCQMALSANSLGAGQTVTLRFKARWLHGWPEVLLRLNGNWLEATAPMPVPANLGTPGARNSRYVTNAGPAIYAVTHTPAVPAAYQAVVVTARVHDPDGVQNLSLFYRVDPATAYTAVPMRDDGAAGDDIAGDGIFSATIPGRASGSIVAFYVSATDTRSTATRFPALLDDNAPARECVVMFGDGNPSGSFSVYHLWVTQTNVTRWISLSDLSNESHDCTMVNGTRVIYNAQARFAGSPYHQGFDSPYGNLCHYKWIFPDDDKFLGATSYNKMHQPGNGAGDDSSIQREQLANSFLRALGAPWLNRRYVAVFVNGRRRGTLMEDAQTPDADVVKERFPNDTGGWLYKMQPWFEFGPFPQGASVPFNNYSWCNLMPYTTTGGVKKVARYRYNFLVRRTPVSANDYTNVFSLVDAASSYGTPNYVANMQGLADMENWMRVFAANHAAGNWDSFGCNNSQNLYGYLGTQGTKYSLMMWDFNIVIGNSGSWGPGQNLFSVNGQDPNTQNIYNEPAFRRMYWRALQELVNGPLDTANSGPLMDAKYNTFAANGLNLENPNTNIKPWLTSARASIAQQLAVENATSFVLNSPVAVNNNTAVIAGTAPVNVKTVLINGVEFPVTWSSVTGFSITVPLQPGTNLLSVVGVDIHGQPIAGTSNNVAVVYNGSLPSPAGQIVINEIMSNPAIARSQYVELYNASAFTYDLSGWQFKGLGYTFPQGSTIAPNGYLVLAADRPSFAAAYGATVPVFDVFGGTLQADGETLTLLQPGTNTLSDVTVAKVRYSGAAPWPTNANGTGSSLQLIDPRQDNWRAGNWNTVTTNPASGPQWQYVTVTGTAPRPILLICMHGTPGDVYIDDLKLVAGSVPEAGVNLLTNGDFESTLTGPWTVSTNLANSLRSTSLKHSGNASLHVIATSPGDSIPLSIWENTAAIVTNGTYTLSYWYLPTTNGTQLLIRLSGTSPGSGQVYSLQNIQPQPAVSSLYTPGATNSTLTSLPPFPPLWINEIQADNLTGITNSVGQHTPWLELYNPTANPVDLAGLFLANDYANLTAWSFPVGASINPGEFKVVFADGQANLSTANELHTSFALQSGSGSLALSRLYNGQPQVLDYVDYTNVAPNHSYGSVPDGQSFDRQELAFATPGSSNNASAQPSFIPYPSASWVYAQNFDALPNPGATSVNSANPVTINGITYSLANPFDFAYPNVSSGSSGGLGLAALAGWYGLGSLSSKLGATDGDQTTGGVISFGLPGDPNRAVGLLATSSTGPTALGARFINYTGRTLNYINLQFTGELWRQSDLPKNLTFYYFIDPTGASPFSTTATAFVPSLNVSFPTSPGATGGIGVDGTAPANQSILSVQNLPIVNWPPGAALWLVWQMSSATGKAQGLAIDNLTFSASDQLVGIAPGLGVQAFGTNFVMSWPTISGQLYQIEYKDDLNASVWNALGSPVTGTGATLSVTNDVTQSAQRFYRLKILP